MCNLDDQDLSATLSDNHRYREGETLSALSLLNAIDRCQNKPAREKP
jgi:hypothetical protein